MTGNLQQFLGQSFDASEVPISEYELLPEGDYTLQIIDSEMKSVKNDGIQLVFTMQVVGSTHDGSQLRERLNIKNNNEKAVEISFQTLAKIVQACGLVKVNDSSELHGKKFIGHVAVKKGEGTYMKDGVEKPSADQNVIKKYMPIGSAAQSAGAATSATAAATTEGAKKMPWAK
jgi:hypothetical protein